jgi:NAD(P)-dependent dehydrogenase (short-subunit alcohol dehydrogenase family)
MAVAVITGASRGFGLALAERLAADGWNLVLAARGSQALDAAAEAVKRAAPAVTVRAVAGDVADPEHRRALVVVASEIGGIDLLVNNAGLLGPSPQPVLAE